MQMRVSLILMACLLLEGCAGESPAPVVPSANPLSVPLQAPPFKFNQAATLSSASEAQASQTMVAPLPWHRVSLVGQAVASSGDAPHAADDNPTTEWNPQTDVAPGQPQWLSLPLVKAAQGPLAVLFTGHGLHYEQYDYGKPRSYEIRASSDSTNGRDGNWRVVSTVVDNVVRSRVSLIQAPGAMWIRLVFTDAWDSFFHEPFLREVAVYEGQPLSPPDVGLIMGDSITSVAFDPQRPAYCAQAIAEAHSPYTPMILSGGTGGDTAQDAAARLAIALPTLPTGSVVGLLYGSNDATHGENLGDFKTGLEAAIALIRGAGDVPVLGITSWTENGQISQYAQVCRDLIATRKLAPGPDFYTYFKTHPEQLQVDKVHPNDIGAEAMQRMWAASLAFRYPAPPAP
jgi:lysophospholipase L1-like esterase